MVNKDLCMWNRPFQKKHAKGTKLPADAKNKGEGWDKRFLFPPPPTPSRLTCNYVPTFSPVFARLQARSLLVWSLRLEKKRKRLQPRRKQEKLKILENPLVLLVRTCLKGKSGNLHRSAQQQKEYVQEKNYIFVLLFQLLLKIATKFLQRSQTEFHCSLISSF